MLSFKENDTLAMLDKNPAGGLVSWTKGKLCRTRINQLLTLAASAVPSNKVTTTALYDYDAQRAQELSFKEGESIEILQKNEDSSPCSVGS